MNIKVKTIKSENSTKNRFYIIYETVTKKGIIIDPTNDVEQIYDTVYKEKLNIKAIFVTHSHYDHISGVEEVSKNLKCKVYISSQEKEYYEMHDTLYKSLEDKEIVSISNNFIVECILTPGHTKGSMCYLVEDYIFTGDTLFIEGCGICTGLGANTLEMFDSINKLKYRLHDRTLIYPGHVYKYDVGRKYLEVKKLNIYLNIEDEEEFKKFRNRKNQTNLFDFN